MIYPVAVYNGDGAQLTCDDEAAFLKAKSKGYKIGYVHTEYPTTLYSAKGEARKIDTPDEKAAALAAGWSEEFVAPAPAVKPAVAQEVSAESSTIRALFAEIGDLKARLAALEGPPPPPSLPAPSIPKGKGKAGNMPADTSDPGAGA